MTVGSYHTTVPGMDVGEAMDIARATNQELHARGYADAAAARERASERLADVVEDLQARINHIIWSTNHDVDDATIGYRAYINELARGIAPEATTRFIERAS